MALIGNIRKNFWIVLVLLGLALVAFILMEAVSASNRGGAGPEQVLGTVAGKDINYREFSRIESAFSKNGGDRLQAREAAWNYFVGKKIAEKQSEDLGISVGNDEIMDLQFGPNYSPVIRQKFTNPQTGQMDNQQLLQIKQVIESGDYNDQLKNEWTMLKDEVVLTSKSSKINNLVSKAIYTPSFMVKEQSNANNQTVDFDYVKIPFDNIDDSEVEVTDTDVQNYLNANSAIYASDFETRNVEYAVLDVYPSAQDSLELRQGLIDIKNTFEESTTDSLFAVGKEGYVTSYVSPKSVISQLGDVNLVKGQVYGPYLNGNAYQIAKVLDKAIVPDSVQASHILVKEGEAKIDSIQTLIKNGRSFASAAEEFGQDGTSTSGGDLGTFSAERMVPEFSAVCFSPNAKKGKVYKVRSRFGWHLVKITKQKFNSRSPKSKLAIIPANIVPSQGTQDALYDEMNAIAAEVKTLEQLKEKVNATPNVKMQMSAPLGENAYQISNLGSSDQSRDIIKWAYNASINDISPQVYTYTNNKGYYNSKYVIPGLSSVTPAGLPSVANARPRVSELIKKEKKGALIASKISGTDLSKIASDNNTEITSLTGVKGNSGEGLGYEPKVIYKAMNLGQGQVSKAIVGNNGVYIVKTNAISESPAVSNIGTARSTANTQARNGVLRSLFNSLKEAFKPEDNRSRYF